MNRQQQKQESIWGRLRSFWRRFLEKVFGSSGKREEPERPGQPWRDVEHINLLSVFVGKLNNLCNTEATFGVDSDSAQVERLRELCADLEDKRYDVTAPMLADGDFFVFPATNDNGEIVHDYLPQDRVRIVTMEGDEIREAFAIVDWIDEDGEVDYLLRRHVLDANGTLTISYQAVSSTGEDVSPAEWEDLLEHETVYQGANHIGFGRYKSPQDSRGRATVYGVPLNYGCSEIEERIFGDFAMIEDEFVNGKSVIFTDPKNLLKDIDVKRQGYHIADNVIPISRKLGEGGPQIEIFSPALRFSSFYEKLISDMELMERTIGTSKGILTPNETQATATATAVKRSNADTIALIEKIRAAMDAGNEMTLEADAVYLGVARDLWSYRSDWYDPFEDPADQFSRLAVAIQNGYAEKEDGIRWMFPSLTEEEVQEKIARINGANAEGDDELSALLGGA